MFFGLAMGSLAGWISLAVARGGFWLDGPELPIAEEHAGQAAAVAVVVPARDEAETLEPVLRFLLAQRYAGTLHVVLVDDNSADGTGDLARALAATDHRLRVVEGAPLPPGWTGKLWAVAQGLRQPEVSGARYVLLTDADIIHAPGHMAQLVQKAETDSLDLVSEMVQLRTETMAERATIPAFVWFFAMLYPFRWVGQPSRGTAAAAGGTMLVSSRALQRIGGVDSIRGELIDDCALARQIKRSGHRIWLGHATQAESLRPYQELQDVSNMVARTAYVQLGFSSVRLLGTCAGMGLLYGVPVAAAVAGRGRTRLVGLASLGLMAGLFQPVLKRYRRNPAWGFALPGIAAFYLAATVGSAVRHHRGQGGGWKGRVYPASAPGRGA